MNKMKKMIPLVLAIILVIGMFPVYTVSAKTAKPAKPKLTLKVTDVTEGYVRVLIKIGKTKNAEGYEIYEEDLAHGETEFRNIYTLEKSGTQEREYAIRYSHRDGKLAIKVRAYNGTKFGKFSKVKTIDFTKYQYKEPKPEKEAITKDGDILYNSNQIKISYKGLKDNKVNFEIKNNRNGSVRYGVYGCAVNSCMIHSKVYGMNDILSGKKVNESYSIYDTED